MVVSNIPVWLRYRQVNQESLEKTKGVAKQPGPPPGLPPKPGLEWKYETHRWLRPEGGTISTVLESPESIKPDWYEMKDTVTVFHGTSDLFIDDMIDNGLTIPDPVKMVDDTIREAGIDPSEVPDWVRGEAKYRSGRGGPIIYTSTGYNQAMRYATTAGKGGGEIREVTREHLEEWAKKHHRELKPARVGHPLVAKIEIPIDKVFTHGEQPFKTPLQHHFRQIKENIDRHTSEFPIPYDEVEFEVVSHDPIPSKYIKEFIIPKEEPKELKKSFMEIHVDLEKTRGVATEEGPAPGPPPRPGLEWEGKTHRWIRPEEAEQADEKSPKVKEPEGPIPENPPEGAEGPHPNYTFLDREPDKEFVVNEKALKTEAGAEHEFYRALRTQYKMEVPCFHETFIENLESIADHGLEEVAYAAVGQPSDFVTTKDKLIVEFGVYTRDVKLLHPDMMYTPADDEDEAREGSDYARLLRQHKGVYGAYVSYDDDLPPGNINAMYVVRDNKVVETYKYPFKKPEPVKVEKAKAVGKPIEEPKTKHLISTSAISTKPTLTPSEAPGPPPRPGLEWNVGSHRWVRSDVGSSALPGEQEARSSVNPGDVDNAVKEYNAKLVAEFPDDSDPRFHALVFSEFLRVHGVKSFAVALNNHAAVEMVGIDGNSTYVDPVKEDLEPHQGYVNIFFSDGTKRPQRYDLAKLENSLGPSSSDYLSRTKELIGELRQEMPIEKARGVPKQPGPPPGPPPKADLVWNPQSHRWVNPKYPEDTFYHKPNVFTDKTTGEELYDKIMQNPGKPVNGKVGTIENLHPAGIINLIEKLRGKEFKTSEESHAHERFELEDQLREGKAILPIPVIDMSDKDKNYSKTLNNVYIAYGVGYDSVPVLIAHDENVDPEYSIRGEYSVSEDQITDYANTYDINGKKVFVGQGVGYFPRKGGKSTDFEGVVVQGPKSMVGKHITEIPELRKAVEKAYQEGVDNKSGGSFDKIKPTKNRHLIARVTMLYKQGMTSSSGQEKLEALAKAYFKDGKVGMPDDLKGNVEAYKADWARVKNDPDMSWAKDHYNERGYYNTMNRSVDNIRSAQEFVGQEMVDQFAAEVQITQDDLKKRFPEGKVTLYRGFSGNYGRELSKAVKKDGSADIDTLSFSSWTTNRSVAQTFGQTGCVIKREVPIEDVLFSHFTTPYIKTSDFMLGGEEESEFIVGHPSKTMKVEKGEVVSTAEGDIVGLRMVE